MDSTKLREFALLIHDSVNAKLAEIAKTQNLRFERENSISITCKFIDERGDNYYKFEIGDDDSNQRKIKASRSGGSELLSIEFRHFAKKGE